MRLPAIFSVLNAGCAPIPAGADTARIATRLAGHPAVPGTFVGWTTRSGRSVAAAGERAKGSGVPVTERDIWHIGSLTKSMTATLAARMVERCVIGWETTAGEMLASAHPGMAEHWRDVTLSEFLRHGSGMRPNAGYPRAFRVGQGSRDEYVAAVLSSDRAARRGGFHYSNAGYVTAGAMLEAAGGAPWEDLVAGEIFAPLRLSSAGFGAPEGNQPKGHRVAFFGGLRPVEPGPRADNGPALGPAGRVHLSGMDMLRYLRAHLSREARILSAESWDRLHRPEGPGSYAMGWAEVDGVLRHSGSNGLWFAQMRLYKEEGVAVFVAVNSAVFGRVRGLVEAAAEAAHGDALRSCRG